MRIPPNSAGHGGAQRAWLLVNALSRHGPVHLVLLHREDDRDLDLIALDPSLDAITASVTVVAVRDWTTVRRRAPWLPWSIAVWLDLLIKGSGEAPRIGATELRAIAASLPRRRFATVFAGRLPTAVIAERMLALGVIAGTRRVVDFDDVLSQFKRRQRAALAGLRPLERWLQWLDIRLVARAERRIAGRWDAVSVCKDDDVALLRTLDTGGRFVTIPNAIDRLFIDTGMWLLYSMLFVGNLSFAPNAQGLDLFLTEAWPRIRAGCAADLVVVGMAPDRALAERLAGLGVALHVNVATVEPFYRDSDAVICPVTFGGGTRIKLLEAMAYGRPIVSTVLGAEGLGLVDGEHALLGATVADLADPVLRRVADPVLRHRRAAAARHRQQVAFGPTALDHGVAAMIDPAVSTAR